MCVAARGVVAAEGTDARCWEPDREDDGRTAVNEEQRNVMASGRGFIAALDQSGGSTPKALKLYGIEEDAYDGEDQMFDLIHQMRTRLISSPSFTGDKVIATILFEQTMDRAID